MREVLFAALFFGIALVGGPHSASAQQPSAAGLWEQVDETSGKPESWFRISEEAGLYKGVLVKGFPKPGEDPASWKCEKCEGPEKNAPVVGLTLIKNMKRNGLNYDDGTITDPRDGTVYRALMRLRPDGKTLEVRGYVGIALLGRTQVWNRLSENAMDPPPGSQAPSKGAPAAKKTAPAPRP